MDSEAFSDPNSVPEPNIKQAQLADKIDLDMIHFDFDKSDIKPEYKTVLDEHVKWMKAQTEYNILIEGHTDNRGSINYNLGLGQERATKVRSYLAYFGVSPTRIATISYGGEKPILNNSDEESWAKNRRVEFHVYKR